MDILGSNRITTTIISNGFIHKFGFAQRSLQFIISERRDEKTQVILSAVKWRNRTNAGCLINLATVFSTAESYMGKISNSRLIWFSRCLQFKSLEDCSTCL
jgi:hypothetical protein